MLLAHCRMQTDDIKRGAVLIAEQIRELTTLPELRVIPPAFRVLKHTVAEFWCMNQSGALPSDQPLVLLVP